MKLGSKISILLLAICQNGWAQGFVNLDFEHPILPLTPNGGLLPAANAIPGWAAYFGGAGPQTSIYYNGLSLGGEIVALQDTNAPGGVLLPIQGNYSVLLEGSTLGAATTASIGQTGTIPNTAQSLTFWGLLAANIQGQNLQISFNNQPLSFVTISNDLINYPPAGYVAMYGVDVSPFAGQTGQLLFTVPVQGDALLDNIQFSSIPIPEPAESALAALGMFIFGFLYRRNVQVEPASSRCNSAVKNLFQTRAIV